MKLIHIRTTRHPSGRLTCQIREDDEKAWRDLGGTLFGNFSSTEFYQSVDALCDELQRAGHLISYDDAAARL